MLALLDQKKGPFVADEAEATIARNAADKLAAIVQTRHDIKIVIQGNAEIMVPLPSRAVAMIFNILEQMANRAPFSIIPHEAEFSTQQAADFLNVSRPFLTKLIDAEKIPHRRVGRHRRIKVGDLIAFEKESREKQHAALEDMAKEAKRLGLE